MKYFPEFIGPDIMAPALREAEVRVEALRQENLPEGVNGPAQI